jgi:ATP-binding cassette, subfamily F, member 3
MQIVGDDTTALDSVLKADVWRDHLLAEEARLNARLAELDATPPGESDARLEEMRDEVSGRLAEVHASLADMDAESGPSRAAALLAGGLSICFVGLLQGI